MEVSNSSLNSSTSDAAEGVRVLMKSTANRIAGTYLGQMVLKMVDRLLWVVEKSMEWSLPIQEIIADENQKIFGRTELVKPLPWILFIPLLLILRLIKIALNIAVYLFGYPQIQPIDVVKFIQKYRRWLKIIKINSIRSTRRKTYNDKGTSLTLHDAKQALIRSIRLTLSSMSCLDVSNSNPSPPATRILLTSEGLEMISGVEEISSTESHKSSAVLTSKRKYSTMNNEGENEDENESAKDLDHTEDEQHTEDEYSSFLQKLDKLAMVNSSEDEDYVPSNTSTTDTTSESDQSLISDSEIKDIINERRFYFPSSELLKAEINAQENIKNKRIERNHDKMDDVCSCDNNKDQDSYSTGSFDQDNDTFYSPNSCRSSSPERWLTPTSSVQSEEAT